MNAIAPNKNPLEDCRLTDRHLVDALGILFGTGSTILILGLKNLV